MLPSGRHSDIAAEEVARAVLTTDRENKSVRDCATTPSLEQGTLGEFWRYFGDKHEIHPSARLAFGKGTGAPPSTNLTPPPPLPHGKVTQQSKSFRQDLPTLSTAVTSPRARLPITAMCVVPHKYALS